MRFLKQLWILAYVFGITVLLLSLFFWIVDLFWKKRQIDDSWVKSYCQISKIMAKNGPNIYVRYWVKDSLRSPRLREECAASLRSKTAEIGEIFPILYDPESPDELFVFTWKPLFLKDDITKSTTGTIAWEPSKWGIFEEQSKEYNTDYIGFTFKIDGEVYKKSQDLPPMFKTTYPGRIKKGDRFEVQYSVENPQRAIIHLDKPMP